MKKNVFILGNLQGKKTIDELSRFSDNKLASVFGKTIDVARKWKETADKMAEEHGFIQWRIRSVDIYKDYEAEHIKDYDEFE